MFPLDQLIQKESIRIRGVLTDIDDTLTSRGRLTAEAYEAMERLQNNGFLVIPVTGRPAGWCDHIARMWPVDAVVGENGAFYFRYDHDLKKMHQRFLHDPTTRKENRQKLEILRNLILKEIPGTAVASDQNYREADLAIDFCEDVKPLSEEAVERIVQMFQENGATAKMSSIHVNGWFGEYDKLGMTRKLLAECFEVDLNASESEFVFVGDSPNDSPMFAFFSNSVGVANVARHQEKLLDAPKFISKKEGGAGFVEVADVLIRMKKG
ncbi:MAG: HAD-IIB family hydrolase [SAR324 cluster bacterium]|nr:HAD-IIB family hydrolase [SAR324 cluster bacterium]